MHMIATLLYSMPNRAVCEGLYVRDAHQSSECAAFSTQNLQLAKHACSVSLGERLFLVGGAGMNGCARSVHLTSSSAPQSGIDWDAHIGAQVARAQSIATEALKDNCGTDQPLYPDSPAISFQEEVHGLSMSTELRSSSEMAHELHCWSGAVCRQLQTGDERYVQPIHLHACQLPAHRLLRLSRQRSGQYS